MARITVEDCLRVVPNRFKLIVLAAQRAHAILSGSKARVNRDDREIVLALREIAENKIDTTELWNAVVNKYRKDGSAENAFSAIESNSVQLFSAGDFDMDMGEDIFNTHQSNEDKNADGADNKILGNLNLEVED